VVRRRSFRVLALVAGPLVGVGAFPAVAGAQTEESADAAAVEIAVGAFADAELPADPAGEVPLVVVTESDEGARVEVVHVDDVEEAADTVAEHAENGTVVAVQVDELVELLDGFVDGPVDDPSGGAVAPEDTLVDLYPQWPFDAPETTFTTAWATTRGAGQVVAVVDTGVYGNHEDLGGAVLPGTDFVHSACDQSTGDGRTDLNGHGTHVAGIIAARSGNWLGIAGAAPDAMILPVRVLGPVCENGQITNKAAGYASDVAAGILWAADHGATVINLSLGASGEMEVVNAAITYAVSKRIPVVAAAGNSGANTRSYPAASSKGEAIAVAATDRNRQLAPYSSWSTTPAYVDLAAPGSGITSTWSPEAVGANGARYMVASGTSMSTPHVAAAAALVRSVRPDLDVAGLRSVLEGTASDLLSAGVDAQTGAGMVDPANALHVLVGGAVSTGSGYHALTGARAIDTRSGPKITAGGVASVQVGGAATGVPASATAAALNVTAVEAEGVGYLTVWPASSAGECITGARPDTSTVNFVLGDVRATGAIVGLGGGGRVCVYSSAPAHLLVDVTGYLAPDAPDRLTPVVPQRLVDTRGADYVSPRVLRVGMPAVASGATAVAVNLTVTEAQADGFLTAYAADTNGNCGSPSPTSNLNFRRSMTRANLAYVTLGGGVLCVFSSAPAHVIVDLTAYLGPSGQAVFVARAPQRLVDTRAAGALLAPAGTSSVALAAGTVAAQLNVTATDPGGDGFLTVWPCADARPGTSTVNYRVGETSPNGTTVSAAGGSVCYASNVPTHVIVDSTGAWIAAT
jgi:subtilisin family serine protease